MDQRRLVIPFEDLEHTAKRHELVGIDHDVPFSIILIHDVPGSGPGLHRHPYPEVFVVQVGEATFQLAARRIVVPEGHVVIGPSDVPHSFTNTGTGELRILAIHGNPQFITESLEGPDEAWRSKPPPR